MSALYASAAAEFRIALRNRWVTIAAAMMALFAALLAAAGSAAVGEVAADRLSVTVASLTSLAVYLVPLIALLMAFDAIAGEIERGTLPLALSYPVARATLLAGKFVAHLGVLGLALVAGYGTAAVAAFATDPESATGLPALARLTLTSLALGATFLLAGYWLSALARRAGAAAGLAIGLWLVAVVLYDLGLLAAVVAAGEGFFATRVFPWLLVGNPADSFRLYNLAASGAAGAAAGVDAAAASIPPIQALASILLWPLAAFGLALRAFARVTP